MKTNRHFFLAAIFALLLMGNATIAQDKKAPAKAKATDKAKTPEKPAEEKHYIITVTTLHWNMDRKDFSMDAWKAGEKEYYDKVTAKNDLVLGQEVLLHYFTADNTEILLVTMYDSWASIEKAYQKDNELVKAAWPDEKARTAYFEKGCLLCAEPFG
jgi:hypothetical protein